MRSRPLRPGARLHAVPARSPCVSGPGPLRWLLLVPAQGPLFRKGLEKRREVQCVCVCVWREGLKVEAGPGAED